MVFVYAVNVGEWIMLRVKDWIHIKTSNIKVSDFSPTQVGEHRKRLLQPWFYLEFGKARRLLCSGRPLLWALVDALFPENKIPRQVMLNSIKDNHITFEKDLQAFFQESEVPVLSILVGNGYQGEVKDPRWRKTGFYPHDVLLAVVPSDSMKAPDIEDLRSKVEGGVVVPCEWKDRNGVTRVPSLIYGTPTAYAQAVDVGKRVVVTGHFTAQGGVVRPLSASVVEKKPVWLITAQGVINTHYEASLGLGCLSFPSVFDPIPSEVYSMELFSLQHTRRDLGF